MEMEQIITDAFKGMANVETAEEKNKLRREAKQCTLSEWKAKNRTKVALVGASTGLVGGPIGLALEGVDMAVLLRVCSRACYGIGYILDDKDLNYDLDINMILAIWTGCATAAMAVPAGKLAVKVGAKTGVMTATNLTTPVAAKAAAKVITKVSAKSSLKFGAVVAKKAGQKLVLKAVGKTASKWIPLVGSFVSVGINLWLLNGLIEAAEKYYQNEYVIMGDELAYAFA